MTNASTLGDMSPELVRVVERAQREPEGRLQDLHDRLKSRRYRHQPIRRVHIPNGQGRTRPIGISTFEDKLVQDALREVLEAIYEQDFLNCSYGFRPRSSAHDAVRTLKRIVHRGEVSWILEADVVFFFDSVDRAALVEMLQTRVADGSLMRLIGKCLHVGVLDGEVFSRPEIGTAQGSVLSPILGNVYLHCVLDLWFETEVKPRMWGRATLIPYRLLIGSSVDRIRLERLPAARHHAWGLERLGFALLTAAMDAERGSSEPERRRLPKSCGNEHEGPWPTRLVGSSSEACRRVASRDQGVV